jgi:hypothetical protein
MNRFGELVIPHIDTEDACNMDPESAAGIGWKECKKEVLRILNNTRRYKFSEHYSGEYLNKYDIIKEIEKL